MAPTLPARVEGVVGSHRRSWTLRPQKSRQCVAIHLYRNRISVEWGRGDARDGEGPAKWPTKLPPEGGAVTRAHMTRQKKAFSFGASGLGKNELIVGNGAGTNFLGGRVFFDPSRPPDFTSRRSGSAARPPSRDPGAIYSRPFQRFSLGPPRLAAHVCAPATREKAIDKFIVNEKLAQKNPNNLSQVAGTCRVIPERRARMRHQLSPTEVAVMNINSGISARRQPVNKPPAVKCDAPPDQPHHLIALVAFLGGASS
ncbi:hypothetical protein EVAR_36673_1 [Eumeta japonica]|uniref:Uncharacterized protein n=1 Tax=Eumeta variegata TaxID=151549 RepID=A0A4C1Z6D5_EUMVA|nr:hypothetical protein EVAR_36673_1 [Eumeta japonica]